MEFSHIPVLLQPCLDGLNIDPAGIYLDGHRPAVPVTAEKSPNA